MRAIGIKKKDLIWNAKNTEHIAKHNLTKYEVEQVFKVRIAVREFYEGRIMIIGKFKNRILSIVLKKQGTGYLVVTARDASKIERRIYRDEE